MIFRQRPCVTQVAYKGDKMGRGQLQNSIPELQLEWATKYGTSSIRHYLTKVKGLTERQYRYLMAKADQNSWLHKRSEIESKVEATYVETYADKVFKSTTSQHKSAQLALYKITSKISKLKTEDSNSIDFYNLTKALAIAQEVSLKALGLSEESLRRMFKDQDTQVSNLKPINEEKEIAKAVQRLSYDDVVDIIKAKRRKLRELNMANSKTTADEEDTP